MATIDIQRQDDVAIETSYGVRADTSSRGVDLEGAQITVTYVDGTSEVLTWAALDPYTYGGASGTDIDMVFGYDWHDLKTTKPLATLKIDLAPANSVFDTTLNMHDGSTPGSLNGFPFKLAPDYEDLSGTISATYSGVVNLAGSPAVGDLYTTMTLDFTGLPEGGLLGQLVWNSDIDTMTGPFDPYLSATDDTVTISGDGSEILDVLGNDAHGGGGALTITAIDGQAVVAGGSVTLASGEEVTLNADGTLSIRNDSHEDETNSFTYTVTDESGNSDSGSVTVQTAVVTPACFVAGTLMDTAQGPVAVEDLQPGMLVCTRDHGAQPLRWIGSSTRRAIGRDAPVVLAAGALGTHAQLAVSPNHRILVTSDLAELLFGQAEVLVKACDLVNDHSIRVRADGAPVTYLHLLFDRHEIVFGNGLPSESYHPRVETLAAFDVETRAEVLRLFPDLDAYGPTARLAPRSRETRLLALSAG